MLHCQLCQHKNLEKEKTFRVGGGAGLYIGMGDDHYCIGLQRERKKGLTD
jgi:hypothetical protein